MNKKIIISSLLVLIASLFFVCNDAIINYLSPKGIKFYHFIFYGSPAYLSVPLYLALRGTLIVNVKSTNYFIPLLRSLIFLPLPFITFITLKNISLPEYTTLNMTTPIFAVIISIFYLKEKMNNLIILSLIFGIIGVYFVVQPGFDSFNPFFILVLFGAFLITISIMIVNKYNKVTTSIGYFIYGGIFSHILSFIFFIIDPIIVDYKTFFLITISSIVINLAICLMVFAFQSASKFFGSLNCLIYIQILWSVLFGIIIFDERLNHLAMIGAFLIVISGLISMPAQYKQLK